VASSEQCGRTKVTRVLPLQSLASWLADVDRGTGTRRIVLSLAPGARPPAPAFADADTVTRTVVLSGPEGGLSGAEEAAALAAGFVRVGLGPRTLRADTAPVALLAWIAARSV
jgi:16S rRNA (uracil1498-N3)-methyltransferase